MSATQKILIEATTEAAISDLVVLVDEATTMTFVGIGYTGDENATLEIYDPAVDNWATYSYKGETYGLNANTNGFDVWMSHGQYRMNKSATATPRGVTVRYSITNTTSALGA